MIWFGEICRNHSHKKRKDGLETQAELALRHTYIENQAILEPILLYRSSKCNQTKEEGSEDLFYLFIRLLSAFFLFYVKMQIKQDQNVL